MVDSQGSRGSVGFLHSYPQDPGVSAEALSPHGETQCQHQHACPQPGHRLGPQPAEVRVSRGPPEPGPGGGSGRDAAVRVPWRGRGGEGGSHGARGETRGSGLHQVGRAHPFRPFWSLREVPEGSASVFPHADPWGPQPEEDWPLSSDCRASVLQSVGELASTPFPAVHSRLGEMLTSTANKPLVGAGSRADSRRRLRRAPGGSPAPRFAGGGGVTGTQGKALWDTAGGEAGGAGAHQSASPQV